MGLHEEAQVKHVSRSEKDTHDIEGTVPQPFQDSRMNSCTPSYQVDDSPISQFVVLIEIEGVQWMDRPEWT
jgi:hypothetical protein